jgi:hypothetical protein
VTAEELMTADLLRRAAEHPDASPRLLAAADAIREGKFTWEDVADGTGQHPLARRLHAPRSVRTLQPLLESIRLQLPAAPEESAAKSPERLDFDDEEDVHGELADYVDDAYPDANATVVIVEEEDPGYGPAALPGQWGEGRTPG